MKHDIVGPFLVWTKEAQKRCVLDLTIPLISRLRSIDSGVGNFVYLRAVSFQGSSRIEMIRPYWRISVRIGHYLRCTRRYLWEDRLIDSINFVQLALLGDYTDAIWSDSILLIFRVEFIACITRAYYPTEKYRTLLFTQTQRTGVFICVNTPRK